MARATNVKIASSTVNCIDMKKKIERDNENKPMPNLTFTMNGNPSKASALREAIKKANHKNVVIHSIVKNEIEMFNLTAAEFIANSEVCVAGVVYGHEYITREFVYTKFNCMYFDDEFNCIEKELTYDGKTTLNKLQNYACEHFENANVGIDEDSIKIIKERRYMTKEKYLEIGKKKK